MPESSDTEVYYLPVAATATANYLPVATTATAMLRFPRKGDQGPRRNRKMNIAAASPKEETSVLASKTLLEELGPIQIPIGQESYTVEVDEGLVFLTHPRWSLLGCGDDMKEAIHDLLQEAAKVVDALAGRPAHELSVRTHAMYRFAQDLLIRGA